MYLEPICHYHLKIYAESVTPCATIRYSTCSIWIYLHYTPIPTTICGCDDSLLYIYKSEAHDIYIFSDTFISNSESIIKGVVVD